MNVFLDKARWMSVSDFGRRLSKSFASSRIGSDVDERALLLTFLQAECSDSML
jgi:hypothetical protein